LSSRARKGAMRAALRLLKDRTDPHGFPMKSQDVLKSMVVSEIGEVKLWIRPKMPHCPCCLYDLSLLLGEFGTHSDVKSIEIVVVEIPGAEEWSAALRS
jgi:hypothetical protein